MTSSCIAERYRLTTFSVTVCQHHNCNTGSWIYRVGKYVTQTHHEVFAQANINKAKEKGVHILRHVLYMFLFWNQVAYHNISNIMTWSRFPQQMAGNG